jgi:glucosamine kinase
MPSLVLPLRKRARRIAGSSAFNEREIISGERGLNSPEFLLGIDGGGTQCRARLTDPAGKILGEGTAGPANIRLGLEASLGAVIDAARQSFAEARHCEAAFARVIACLALAGATEPQKLEAARRHFLPFRRWIITTDAHAACVGAHRGRDGGVVIVGTGRIGWAIIAGQHYRVGGWGLPLGDEGSGAWLGRAALQQVLCAYDGRTGWTRLLNRFFEQSPQTHTRLWNGRRRPSREILAHSPPRSFNTPRRTMPPQTH